MKRILLLILFLATSTGVLAPPVDAQNVGLQNALNGLFSPTSAERYFNQGRRQFELEIRHLQQDSGTEDSSILKVDPVIFQHPQNLQQLEQKLLDDLNSPQNRTLPMGSPQ